MALAKSQLRVGGGVGETDPTRPGQVENERRPVGVDADELSEPPYTGNSAALQCGVRRICGLQDSERDNLELLHHRSAQLSIQESGQACNLR